MKRPPGLWILLSAGVLWLSLQDVYGIRATALIFGKSTTSTTTEAPASVSADERIDNETATNTENPEATGNSTTNSTGPTLTGNPQIDYVWDPNLPQELKGYNLSEYPFYERVPETIDKEIDFKCDGLHDGFYASIPHKCQVYHQCLYGTRYDFLCANYTAFDQKTFICHFVSEVDCVNSKDFWHRNDALYVALSTTTVAPLRPNIYTTAPPDGVDRRPGGGAARRPYRPRFRRPQVDYYDDEYYDEDYYEERPRATRGRKRPRPRPRPVYDDQDEEYEDQKYDSRRGTERKRPYRKRNRDRKRPEYDDEDEAVDDRFEDEDFVPDNKRKKNENKRRPPVENVEDEPDQRRPNGKRRYPTEKREQNDDYDRKPPRKSSANKRPINDDYDDELPQSDDSRNFEQRPRKRPNGNNEESPDGRPIIKPSTGTIYDRPRVAPRINLPVPKHAAEKFAFKPAGSAKNAVTTKATPPADEEEYLDEEYEEDPLPKRQKNRNRRPLSENKRAVTRTEDAKDQPSESRQRIRKPEVEEIVETTTSVRPKFSSGRHRQTRPTLPSRKKIVSEEYYDEDEYLEEKKVQDRRPPLRRATSTTSTTSTTTTTTTTTTPTPKKEPVMRIIKRPFLPSRGGSPYSSRGLQPVGLKAVDKINEGHDEEKDLASNNEDANYYEDSRNNEKVEEKPTRESLEEVQNTRKSYFKPSPIMIKAPLRQKYTPPSAEAQELIESEPSYQQTYKTRDYLNSRTTPKPKIVEKNPLDLNEYDVTLNDALNPTLPNLPIRSFPTGFSSGSDYNNYNTVTRPRYVLEPNISPSNQNYVHPNKVVRSHQRYETVPLSQYSTINGNRAYRQQGQTQAIYSGY